MKYGQVGGYGSVPERKRFGVVIGIIVFIIIVFGFGGFLYYKFIYSANAIKVLLDRTFDYLEDVVDNSDYDSVVNEFEAQLNLKSSNKEENEVLKVFNKIDFSGSYGIDYDRNIMSLDVDSNYDDKDLGGVNFYAEYGRGYIYLDNLYDKYIDYSIDNYSELFERKTADTKSIVIGIRKAIKKALRDEYFSVEKVIIDNESVTKTTMDLSGKNYQLFTEDVVKILLEDKSFLESYANVLKKEVEDVKKIFNDLVANSKDSKGEKYVLYTKKFDFVKFEVMAEDSKFILENNNKEYGYEYYEDTVKVMFGSFELKETKDNAGTLKFSYYDDEDFGIEIMVDVVSNRDVEVKEKDVTNSISAEKLTEDDVNKIYNNLLKNEGIVAIKDELVKLFNTDTDENDLPVIMS